MTLEELVQQTAAARGIKHPDDIEALRQEIRIGWNGAMKNLYQPGRGSMTPDQARVVKLRAHWIILENSLRARLTLPMGEEQGFTVVLERVHEHMRELGIEYDD